MLYFQLDLEARPDDAHQCTLCNGLSPDPLCDGPRRTVLVLSNPLTHGLVPQNLCLYLYQFHNLHFGCDYLFVQKSNRGDHDQPFANSLRSTAVFRRHQLDASTAQITPDQTHRDLGRSPHFDACTGYGVQLYCIFPPPPDPPDN